jgi:hypothetical protein
MAGQGWEGQDAQWTYASGGDPYARMGEPDAMAMPMQDGMNGQLVKTSSHKTPKIVR